MSNHNRQTHLSVVDTFSQVIGNSGYELSWFYNPFYPSYWEKIAVEHGYMRCEVRMRYKGTFRARRCTARRRIPLGELLPWCSVNQAVCDLRR